MKWKSDTAGIQYAGARLFYITYADLWKSSCDEWLLVFKKLEMEQDDIVAFKKFYDIKFSQGRVK